MKLVSKVAGISVLAIAGSVVALVPANAAPVAHTVTVRQGDLIKGLSDTRADGSVAFRKEGVRVKTNGSTDDVDVDGNGVGDHYPGWADKAAEYFAISGSLPDAVSMDWYGTEKRPGTQIIFDADGATSTTDDRGTLVAEPATYGANIWLTGGSAAAVKAKAPHTAPGNNNNDGQGSQWYGTLAEWKQALPNAQVLAGGFSLGSGVKGEGMIESIIIGDTEYNFTSDAAPVATNEAPTARFAAAKKNLAVEFDGSFSSDHDGTVVDYAWNFGDTKSSSAAKPTHVYAKAGTYQVTLTVTDNTGATGSATKPVTVTAASAPVVKIKQDVTGFSSVKKVGARKLRVELVSNPLKANTVEGKRLGWTIKVDGRTRFSTQQHADDRDIWTRKFPKHAGRHKVEIFKNGHLVRTIKVNIKA